MSLEQGDLVGRMFLDNQYTDTLDKADAKTSAFGATAGRIALGVGAAFAAEGAAAAVG